MFHRIKHDILSNFRPNLPPGDLADIRDEDDKNFLKKSKDVLDDLEALRLAKLKIFEFRKKIGIPAALILTPICAYADYWLLLWTSRDGDSAAGITFAVLGGLYYWVTKPRRDYAKAYKVKILPAIAKLFGDFTYDISGKIPMGIMQPSKIVPRHDRYKSEDYFTGHYKNVAVQFSEIDLQEKRRSKNNTRYVTIFKGLAILLTVENKKFFGHTILDQNKSKISEWFKERSHKLERAEMVDPEFEEIFDAYTNDQVEARYLIDPVMIERLKGLYEEYEGEKMAAAFYDDKMLILIASKHNHFEPSNIYIPATDPGSILSMKKEVGEILSIIDKLSLYDPRDVHPERQSAAE